MGKNKYYKNSSINFIPLYKKFIHKYIFNLIGEVTESYNEKLFRDCVEEDYTFEYVSFDSFSNHLIFGLKQIILFRVPVKNNITEDDLKLMQCIIIKYLKISIYNFDGKKQHDYVSKISENMNYEYAVQSGICNWVIGDEKKLEKIESLFNILEEWSSKTYEGRNVSYGIVVDTKNNEEDTDHTDYGDFLSFLSDEFSAVITDPITSVFELSSNCKLLRYRSVIDEECNGEVTGYKLINNLPYRFANVITKTVDSNNKIGIFLLSNGDIILAKNQKIQFVKRNSHWLNFNIKAFKNAIIDFIEKNNINQKLIEEIYSTALDVSFSHTGGILALVLNENKIVETIENENILNRSDYISSSDEYDDIEKYLKIKNDKKKDDEKLSEDELKKDINKKILKRKIIKKMINNNFNFIEINRKLRNELVSLDGACIINKSGIVCSFGAIIQNDSGSTGGGRGAAAKKLSTNGMAIKISTDGYIEVYLKQKKVYVIK